MKIRNRNGFAAHIGGTIVKPGAEIEVAKSPGDAVLLSGGWEVVEDAKPKKKAKPSKGDD